MTDSTNIRLFFGKRGLVILNWEKNPTTLRVKDPATGEVADTPDKGFVAKNQWHDIVWTLRPNSMEVLVDGQSRYQCSGSYANIDDVLAVGQAFNSKVSVQFASIEKR